MTLPEFGWKNSLVTPLDADNLEAQLKHVSDYFENGNSAFGSPASVVSVVSTVKPTGVGATDDAVLRSALAACPAQGGTVWVTQGTLKTLSQVVIPPNVTVLMDSGTTWQIAHTDGLNAIVLSASSILVGRGEGSAQSQIEVLGTANIASVVANLNFGSTLQEWAQCRGFHIVADGGATVTGYGIDFRQLFITSFIKHVTINCNNGTIPVGIRVSGGTSQGFGPVYLDDIWVLSPSTDGIYITEANPTLSACVVWMDRINVEHYAQSGAGHGIHIQGFGGINHVAINEYQTESNPTISSGSSAGVYVDGATNVEIDGYALFASPITNKKGVWISNNAHNGRISVKNLANPNQVNPVVQDDLSGFVGDNHTIDRYENAFNVVTYGPRNHYGYMTQHGGGSNSRDNGQAGISVPPGQAAPNTLTVVAGRTYVARFVADRDYAVAKIAIVTTTVEGSSGNDTVDVGIYNQSGANLARIAANGGSTGVFNALGTHTLTVSCSLTAGTVYYAVLSAPASFTGTAPVIAAVTDQSSGQGYGTAFPQLEFGFIAQAQPCPSTLTIASIAGISTVPKFYVRES